MANISFDTVRSLVNVGGWQVRGGRIAKDLPLNAVVSDLTVHDDVIHFHCAKVAEVKNDRLIVNMVGKDRPRQITISGPFMVRQQRKKLHGGGWHEVEQFGTQLLLINVAAQAEYDAEQAEQLKRQQIEAEAKAKADRARVEEERDARISRFLARQMERIGNARIVDLIGSPLGLMLKFDNGHTLNIDLDGGDIYDAWLTVEDSKEKISLDTGEAPPY